MTHQTFAVALASEEDHGWLIDAESGDEARRFARPAFHP